MANFFTADEHHNHSSIITKFIFRPFRDAAHMNETLIQRHNSRVKPADTVYHLGDFKISNKGLVSTNSSPSSMATVSLSAETTTRGMDATQR
jgi:calcineurin-like phosphoesterase family protein